MGLGSSDNQLVSRRLRAWPRAIGKLPQIGNRKGKKSESEIRLRIFQCFGIITAVICNK
jgi:hypothetical protein